MEDYQSYVRKKRKPRRNGENGNMNRRNRSRTRNEKENDKGKSEEIRGSKDSDCEDGRSHRVQRRTAGSVSSRDDDSVSDAADE